MSTTLSLNDDPEIHMTIRTPTSTRREEKMWEIPDGKIRRQSARHPRRRIPERKLADLIYDELDNEEKDDYFASLNILRPDEIVDILSRQTLYRIPLEFNEKNMNIELQINSEQLRTNISPDKELCIICHENMIQSDIISKLNCGHMFHYNCIQNWGKYRQSCPYCNYAIPYKLNQ